MRTYCKLLADGRVVDYRDEELGTRIFWVMEDWEVRLGRGVTVGSVFGCLSRYPSEFALALGCRHLPDLLVEGTKAGQPLADVSAIGIMRRVEIVEGDVTWGVEVGALEKGRDGKYVRSGLVEFCPANELVGLPLVLDPIVRIEEGIGRKARSLGDSRFTVREVLRALVDELTWHGSPAQRDEFAEELRDRADRAQRGDGVEKDPDRVEELAHRLFPPKRDDPGSGKVPD
jgi:hypothetical protein